MNQEITKTSWAKLFTLIIVATLMAELLSGSTPFSRILQLLPQFLLYGSGAVLIREITRRLGLGWKTIILLGFTFGIIVEGLVLQSIFNPHFLGLDIAYGRALGVNWVWAEYLTGLHAFWSITGAIVVSEAIYPKGRNEPWVSPAWLRIIGGIFVLISVAFHFLFVKLFHFQATAGLFLCCALLVVALNIIALKQGREVVYVRNTAEIKPGYSFWVIALITCAAGVLWFLGIGAIMMQNKLSLWITIPAGPLVMIVYFTLLDKWKLVAIRDDKDRLAVAAGLLSADLILGYTGTLANRIDHYGQIGLIILTLTLLAVLFKRLQPKEPFASA
jgi:hypothetical protein